MSELYTELAEIIVTKIGVMPNFEITIAPVGNAIYIDHEGESGPWMDIVVNDEGLWIWNFWNDDPAFKIKSGDLFNEKLKWDLQDPNCDPSKSIDAVVKLAKKFCQNSNYVPGVGI